MHMLSLIFRHRVRLSVHRELQGLCTWHSMRGEVPAKPAEMVLLWTSGVSRDHQTWQDSMPSVSRAAAAVSGRREARFAVTISPFLRFDMRIRGLERIAARACGLVFCKIVGPKSNHALLYTYIWY